MLSYIFLLALPIEIAYAVTCYRNDGTPMQGLGWDADYANNVCNPLAANSHCCSTSDLCLSNGLCLDTGGGNGLEVQACTDKNWGPPCQKVCPDSTVSLGVILFQCQEGGFPYPYCCDHAAQNASECCASGNSFQIEAGSLVLRPFQVANLNLAASASQSVVTLPTSTATTPPIAGSSAPSAATATQPPTGGSHNSSSIPLGIGLGIGIPFIIVTAVLGWLLLRKRSRSKVDTAASGSDEKSAYWQGAYEGQTQLNSSVQNELPVHPSELEGFAGAHELRADRASYAVR